MFSPNMRKTNIKEKSPQTKFFEITSNYSLRNSMNITNEVT